MTQPTPATINDLERLRDILYGEQARTTEQRLSDLEARLHDVSAALESAQHKIGEQINKQGSAHNSAQQELGERLSSQIALLQAELQSLRTDLNQRLDALENTQRQRTEAVRAELLAIIEQKVARQDFGQMLIELGQRLQNGSAAP